MSSTKSAAVRARLKHPVIDSDGHTVEFEPAVLDYLKQVGGAKILERYKSAPDGYDSGIRQWYRMTPEQRRENRSTRVSWWIFPSDSSLDRATISLPKLFYERLDETGIDLSVVYPTLGLATVHHADEELRRAGCRALNQYHADIFREFSDRLLPVAVIPTHTPAEAIEELEHAVKTLGFKAVMMPSYVRRPIEAIAQKSPEAGRKAFWLDNYCIDSAHDYDPLWAKCVELRVAPTFHSGGRGLHTRNTVSNYVYNHIGHFAEADHSICKALFMGGVTRRFPALKFAFLEGGVGWACSLYADMHGHWEKRSRNAVGKFDPRRLDKSKLRELGQRYGGKIVENGKLEEALASDSHLGWSGFSYEDGSNVDDWAAVQIERAEDIRDLFIPNFYFGCEADDPMNALAFMPRLHRFGARFKAIYGSDIGHWDVPDITEVTEEAWELVEHGLITEDDFRDFVFANPVSLWTGMNPAFFKGTVVEKQVEAEMATHAVEASAAAGR
jgi:predicted TIM-barrel fold metal-dependent hydrolase